MPGNSYTESASGASSPTASRATSATAPVGEVLGDTELVKLVKGVVAGTNHLQEVEELLTERPSLINVTDLVSGKSPLHYACSPITRKYSCREGLVRLLLDRGANVFMLDNEGIPCPHVTTDARDREALVSTILGHRMDVQGLIESVAPLSASRLMKRSANDRGFGLFSNIAQKCLYYLYKGAIYLWETEADVEHVVYQPRAASREIMDTQTKLDTHRRKKSIVARGGATDPTYDFSDGELLEKKLDQLESKLELVTHFTIVSGLDSEQTNIPASGCPEWIITDMGVMISVQMNAKGIVLGRGEGDGPAGGPQRRKSHVCGAAASYKAGFGPKIHLYPKSVIHFYRQPSDQPAGFVCCAMDGIRGVLGYVMGKKKPKALPPRKSPKPNSSRSPPTAGFASSSSPVSQGESSSTAVKFAFLGDSLPPPPASGSPAADHRNSLDDGLTTISFEEPSSHLPQGGATPPMQATTTFRTVDAFSSFSGHPEDGASTGMGSPSPPFAPSTSGSPQFLDVNFAAAPVGGGGKKQQEPAAATKQDIPVLQEAEDEKMIFRVVHCDMFPKDGLNDTMKSLCSRWDPWSGTKVDEKILPADTVPLSVQRLGRTKLVLFTSTGPIVAETASYPTQFHTLEMNPDGPVTAAAAKPAPIVPRLRTVLKRNILVQVSYVIEVVELLDDMTVIPLVRTMGDCHNPHKFIPVFHPTEDSLALLYQSRKRQELVRLDFETMKMTSVCRLPKPSSLRFYTAPDNVKGKAAEDNTPLSELWFAFNRNGEEVLRYNVSMHVMSIYSWEDLHQEGKRHAANFTMIRNPRTIPASYGRKVISSSEEADESVHERVLGEHCTWVVMNSQTLKAILAKHVGKGGGLSTFPPAAARTVDPSPEVHNPNTPLSADPTAEEMAAAIDEILEHTFTTVVHAYTGTRVGKNDTQPHCWCASFSSPIDAIRCSLRLIRSVLDAPWPKQVLSLPGLRAEELPYRSKTYIEKKYPEAHLEDEEKTKYRRRGPKVRCLVTSGHANDDPLKLSKGVEQVITSTVDGIVAIDGPVMKIVRPLFPLASASPAAYANIGRVGILVPYELDSRLVEIGSMLDEPPLQ